ncbi:cytochrome P450 [Ganoderma sinense ZZ0214-1]|uniref:Cytochrome P450 n=1 Tax=Ganoderma sinense ZZ0214-1 TaxID=1077348 RepID=A0A2G8SMR5_9APHY|nr:cytochrome P450 [Ganoderma sinense ZZ0214-1]
METILIALEAFSLLIASLAIYRLWLAPLARLPGPSMCAISRLPLMYHEFNGNRRSFIHDLHMKYGPIVRVAPDEVSFATREAVKEIYTSGGSGYNKPPFYFLFEHFDTGNMFSTLEKVEHADIKKQFAERYSKLHVTKPGVAFAIQENVDAFVEKATERLGASVDIYDLLHCFALDGITGHLFYPSGLHSQTSPSDHKIMEELCYQDGLRRAYFAHYFPALWRVYSKLTGAAKGPGGSLVHAYVLNTTRTSPADPYTVLDKLRAVDARDASRPALLSASECMDHLVAGIDTTGDGLCFLMHHLSLPHPSSQRVQAKLHAELQEHGGAPLDDLPYLEAVVKEGLRMFGPVPMSLPRLVPAGGRVVDGVNLPGGTIVSCQAYTLHRLDEGVWADPEEFLPERWLASEGAAERDRLFFAFAAGGRGCIGKHLAMLEMKLLLRDVYSSYCTRIAPEMTASMEQDDQTVSTRPKDQKCLIIFEKLDNA